MPCFILGTICSKVLTPQRSVRRGVWHGVSLCNSAHHQRPGADPRSCNPLPPGLYARATANLPAKSPAIVPTDIRLAASFIALMTVASRQHLHVASGPMQIRHMCLHTTTRRTAPPHCHCKPAGNSRQCTSGQCTRSTAWRRCLSPIGPFQTARSQTNLG